MSKGWFITIEGGEGAGKTTLLARLQSFFERKGCRVISTREPGGIDIAEQIRAIILDRRHVRMDRRTEALLYAAARRQHLVEKVVPALEQGCVVLCDRFIDSSLAYQGYAREIGIDEIWTINRFAVEGTMPDVTILLDIDPAVGLERIRANGEREVNRLDLESIAFHRKVREGYLKVAEAFPERIVVVDVQRPADQVYSEVTAILEAKWKARFSKDAR